MRYINIYKQTYSPIQARMTITNKDIEYGFTKTKCADCKGTGLFELPDNTKEKCVACKGIGKLYVTL